MRGFLTGWHFARGLETIRATPMSAARRTCALLCKRRTPDLGNQGADVRTRIGADFRGASPDRARCSGVVQEARAESQFPVLEKGLPPEERSFGSDPERRLQSAAGETQAATRRRRGGLGRPD